MSWPEIPTELNRFLCKADWIDLAVPSLVKGLDEHIKDRQKKLDGSRECDLPSLWWECVSLYIVCAIYLDDVSCSNRSCVLVHCSVIQRLYQTVVYLLYLSANFQLLDYLIWNCAEDRRYDVTQTRSYYTMLCIHAWWIWWYGWWMVDSKMTMRPVRWRWRWWCVIQTPICHQQPHTGFTKSQTFTLLHKLAHHNPHGLPLNTNADSNTHIALLHRRIATCSAMQRNPETQFPWNQSSSTAFF